jgi:hypothetical protein
MGRGTLAHDGRQEELRKGEGEEEKRRKKKKKNGEEEERRRKKKKEKKEFEAKEKQRQ